MSDSAKTITRRGFAAASASALVGFASPPHAGAQDAGDTLRSEFTRIVSVGVGRQVPGKAAYRVFQIL
jgi:hypothetical protein